MKKKQKNQKNEKMQKKGFFSKKRMKKTNKQKNKGGGFGFGRWRGGSYLPTPKPQTNLWFERGEG